jgi:hypothetical protein
MDTQPVYSIGTILTSFKLAVIAIATVLVIFLPDDVRNVASELILAAVAAFTVFIGDLLGYILTREKVTPIASPNLPVGTVVNANNPNEPTSVVTPT